MNRGVFYSVGVGPGDPELITLKAVRALEKCPVIAAPQTKSGEMLALSIARRAVNLDEKEILPLHFTMSRDRAAQHAAHVKAAELVENRLDEGKDVAMLNLGDVSIYATASYLVEILEEKGYTTRMIPGVTSFCAVAARLNISLTEMNTPLHIVPGSDSRALSDTLSMQGTKVLMKSGRQLPAVLDELKRVGKLEQSAMVCNCGLPDEQVYTDLSNYPDQQTAGYFATIIVREAET